MIDVTLIETTADDVGQIASVREIGVKIRIPDKRSLATIATTATLEKP